MSPIQVLRLRKRTNTITTPPDRLSQLPTELLQNISSFLPLSSRAALSLSSKPIQAIIGSSYKDLTTSIDERGDFLALLEPDPRFRHHFLCRMCGTLHTRQRFDKFNALVRGPWPATCFKATTAQCFGYGFTLHFHHLYLAMQQYRLGSRYGIALHRLIASTVSNIDLDCKLRTNTKPAIIATGELVLRVDYTYAWNKPRKWKEGDITSVYHLEICPHLGVLEMRHGQTLRHSTERLSAAIKCLINHPDASSRTACETCWGPKRCEFCPTEFQVGWRASKKKGMKVEIVAWTNLGKGQRTDEAKWKAVSMHNTGAVVRWATWVWEDGSVREAFDKANNLGKKKNAKMNGFEGWNGEVGCGGAG